MQPALPTLMPSASARMGGMLLRLPRVSRYTSCVENALRYISSPVMLVHMEPRLVVPPPAFSVLVHACIVCMLFALAAVSQHTVLQPGAAGAIALSCPTYIQCYSSDLSSINDTRIHLMQLLCRSRPRHCYGAALPADFLPNTPPFFAVLSTLFIDNMTSLSEAGAAARRSEHSTFATP